ncbi:hypothetical protein FRB91_000098 [Serendipita sp. 411]|nr:hypothetical protein FRC18_003244 [Serendipita sp. 400]KAG8861854.1 hypothetical protein FRB91_000098 [Serendipita sp. 411]
MSCPKSSISSLWAEKDLVTIIILVASNAGSFLLGAFLVFLIVKLRHRSRRQRRAHATTRYPHSCDCVVQLEQAQTKSRHVEMEEQKGQELVVPEQDETMASSPRSLSHTFVRHSIKPPMNMFNAPESGFKVWNPRSSAKFRNIDSHPLVSGVGSRKISEESGRGTEISTGGEASILEPTAASNSYRDQFGKREASATIAAFVEKDRGSFSSCSRDGSFQEQQILHVKRDGTNFVTNVDDDEKRKSSSASSPASSPTDFVVGIVSTPTTGNNPETALTPKNWASYPVKPRPMSTKYQVIGVQRTKSAPRSITSSTARMTAGYGFSPASAPLHSNEDRRSRTISSPEKAGRGGGSDLGLKRNNGSFVYSISPASNTPSTSIPTPLAPVSPSPSAFGFGFRTSANNSPGIRTFANVPQQQFLTSNVSHLTVGTHHNSDDIQSPPLTSLTSAFQSTDGSTMSPASPDPAQTQQVAYVHIPDAQRPEQRISAIGVSGGRENNGMLAADDATYGARTSMVEDHLVTPSETDGGRSSLSRQLSNHAAVSFYQEHAKRHISLPYGLAQSSPVLPDSPSGVIGAAESPGPGSAGSRTPGDFSFARGKPSRLR